MNSSKKKTILAISLCLSSALLQAQNKRPNIVFIMADDLGWTDLGITGSDYYETPNIDRLASQGMLFMNAYAAAANSAPSRACFMTGMYTPRHGVFTVSPPDRGDKTKRKLIAVSNNEDVNSDFVTIAEALKLSGYTCGHVGKWHLGADEDGTGPLSQGFISNIAGERVGTPHSYFYPYQNVDTGEYHIGLEEGSVGEYLTDRLTNEAIKFMNEQKGNSFFLYLSHHAVHTPLQAPLYLIEKYKKKEKGGNHSNAIYAAMIETLDNSVGRVCEAIDSLGIADNTIVVLYSDNGGSKPITQNIPLRGGKGSPYEGGIRVPLIIRWPEKIDANTSSDILVSSIDFYSTFIKITGGTPSIELDGEDIFTMLDSSVSERNLFWHFPAYLESYEKDDKEFRATPFSSIRSGDWKLIYFYENNSTELYNLKNDIGETTNLSFVHREINEMLYEKLMTWLEYTRAPIPTELNPYYLNKE